ncbi:hypothetical protein ABEB36_008327 [Hypothenemus hampei]|uniref:Uncharacterized protein n=1 Tax=Hypothenemus hampei TaxID=57062 RepID=A0ABD1ELI0_HYPHA
MGAILGPFPLYSIGESEEDVDLSEMDGDIAAPSKKINPPAIMKCGQKCFNRLEGF